MTHRKGWPAAVMNRSMLDRFRRSTSEHPENIVEWLTSAPPRKQERILQTAAPAAAPGENHPPVLGKIDEVLARMEVGEFGRCTVCNGEFEVERLELDFSTSVCLDHFSSNQRRDLERDLDHHAAAGGH